MELQRTEEETVESIKEWWRENGMAVIVGLAIGIGSIIGVRSWWTYTQTQSEEASVIYERVTTAMAGGKHDTVFTEGQKLVNDYSGTPYAGLASLMMAKAKYEKDNATGAQLHLRWVIDNASDKGMQHVARIRLARLLLDSKDYVGALTLIDGQQENAFKSFYEELHGDAALAQGNKAEAKDAYSKAMASESDQQRKQVIQMKLDDVSVSTASAAK